MPALSERSPAASDRSCAPSEALSRKFRIDAIIGAGGMAVVVAAHHLALDRRVAIKLMRPELRGCDDLVRRFLREARAAARLNSRHVTRVFDVGILEDGAPYIVMEYLEGIDLAAWLRQRGSVPAALAAAIVLQASEAISEAHAAGIIHRDLKPANLFVTRGSDGESLMKVLDLGICKLIERTDDLRDTSTSTLLGTPVYMAPEQLGAEHRADARSDIWALGVILYELVTGRVPFHGHTVAELRSRAMCNPCPEMDVAGVPKHFEAVVARCLAKDPLARFQRVTELMAALGPFASNVRPRALVAVPAARCAKRPTRWWTVSAVAAIVLASGAWGLTSSLGRGSIAAARPGAPPPVPALPPALTPPSVSAPTAVPSPSPDLAPPSQPTRPRDLTQRVGERPRTAPVSSRSTSACPARHAELPPQEPPPVPQVDAPHEPSAAPVDPLSTPD